MSEKSKANKAEVKATEQPSANAEAAPPSYLQPGFATLLELQRTIGNQVVVRLLRDRGVQANPVLRSSRTSIQRFPANGSADQGPAVATPPTTTPESRGASARALIVDDDATALELGQMKKSTFMAELSGHVCATADAGLAAVGRSSNSCPYIEKWLAFYAEQDSAHIERSLHLYAPEAARATAAQEYFAVIDNRVRQAIATWVETGRITGMPAHMPQMPGFPGSPSTEASPPPAAQPGQSAPRSQTVLAKRWDGGVGTAADPEAIRERLGSGHALDGSTQARMESAFGQNFSRVRLHTDSKAGMISEQLSARAFTVGEHVAFAPGEYQPGTPIGDALLAHELAHVAQQSSAGPSGTPLRKGEGNYEALEEDADVSAVNVIGFLWTGAKGKLFDIARNTVPRLKSGLRLQRCGTKDQMPTDLTTVDAKATWIKDTLAGSTTRFEKPGEFNSRSKSQAIADILGTLSVTEFMDIQSKLDMKAVWAALDDWDAVRVGTYGPIKEAHDDLNRLRADMIYDTTRDRGAAESEVVTHWMFNNMVGDDIKAVLTLLGADQHLYNTVDDMPSVLELLKQRGIDRANFQDRAWKAGDIPRGAGHFVGSLLDSGKAAREGKAIKYAFRDLDLPKEYNEVMAKLQEAELKQALSPGNIVFGTFDYVTFGIPSTIKGFVGGTYSGIKDISEGHVEAGTEKLTGSVVLIVTVALGVRALRRSARMAAMLEMTEEGHAASVKLRASIGQAGIDRVAKYVQSDTQAAFLVREQGLAGIEALEEAGGDVAAARKLIGVDVARLGPLLTADTLAGLTLETQQALATLSDKALSGMAGVDSATMDVLAQTLRESSPAMRTRLTALAESNPQAFGQLLRDKKVAAIEALRTGPFSTVEDLASQVGKSAERKRIPVVKDGKTLYESIDPNKPPPDWTFKDTVLSKRGSVVTIRTDVSSRGANGYFIRRFNTATGELEMLEGFLSSEPGAPELPGKVQGGVELVPGEGTSTQTYATLRQLRGLGVEMGGVRKLIMRDIENFRSICRLEWLKRNFPGRSLNELAANTDSISYASTTVEQSGSRIVGVQLKGGKVQPIGNLMAEYEADALAKGGEKAAAKVRADNDKILKQYGFDRTTPMLTNFDLEADLENIPPAGGGTQ